jgi:hypothetical protein
VPDNSSLPIIGAIISDLIWPTPRRIRRFATPCGTAQYSISYAAYLGETPVLSGGERIQGWQQAPYRPNCWSAATRSATTTSTRSAGITLDA